MFCFGSLLGISPLWTPCLALQCHKRYPLGGRIQTIHTSLTILSELSCIWRGILSAESGHSAPAREGLGHQVGSLSSNSALRLEGLPSILCRGSAGECCQPVQHPALCTGATFIPFPWQLPRAVPETPNCLVHGVHVWLGERSWPLWCCVWEGGHSVQCGLMPLLLSMGGNGIWGRGALIICLCVAAPWEPSR